MTTVACHSVGCLIVLT